MSVNGIYGLSGSGLDIESMVKVGMMSRQNEYDKMAQKYTKNEWTKTELININNQITTFNMSTLSQYKMSSSMNSRTADSSSEAVKAVANATAAVMTHKVEVTGLSTNAYLTTNKGAIAKIIGNNVGNSNYKLSEVPKLSDVLFKDFSTSTVDVTSDYGTQSVSVDSNGIPTSATLKGNTTNGIITETVLTKSGETYTGTYKNTQGENKNLEGGTVSAVSFKFDGYTLSAEGASPTSYTLTGFGDNAITLTKAESGNTFTGTDGSTTITFDGTNLKIGENSRSMTNKTATIKFSDETAVTFNTDVSTSTTTVTTVAKESGIGGFTNGVSIDEAFQSGKAKSSLKETDKAIAFTISDGTKNTDGSYKTATVEFTYADIAGGKTINDLYFAINTKASNAGLNVKASYDYVNDVFSLYNSKGGKENGILIAPVNSNGTASVTQTITQNFLSNLGLQKFDGEKLNGTLSSSELSAGVFGENGTIKVDGIDYETTDNKVTVGGVTYNALNKTDGAATVSVSQDVDSIVDKVKSFVEDYNKLLSSLYEKYDEKPDSNYKPLTQSQKDSMKDEQIEKWENKAKEGLLYHDKTLSKVINDMRSAISTTIEGLGDGNKYNSVYSIGISTTGIKGQLTLDETKLRNALSEDADSVYNVFAKLDTSAEAENGIVKENGVAQRLGDIFTSATKLIRNRAGSSADVVEDSELNTLLRELQTKMSNFKKMMTAFEDKLYKKYDAMESTLAKLGMQLNYITGGTQ